MDKQTALQALAGLAQESRLDIYRLLVERGPGGVPAGEIANKLGMPNTTLSFHLKELSHAGLITGRSEGRFVFYSPNFTAVDGLISYLTDNCCRDAGCKVACVPTTKSKRRAA